jgi:murein DD-endopeptidase MepM/ murein hydrolase activator NlpD
MNIMLFTNRRGRAASIALGRPQFFVPLLTGLLFLCGALLYGGYRLGAAQSAGLVAAGAAPPEWQAELEQQQAAIEMARQDADAHLNALALRLGQMQAQMLRVDALGKRLARMADLESSEFDFDQMPGQGGPDESQEAAEATPETATELPEFLRTLEELQLQLSDRKRKLTVLEGLVMDRHLKAQVQPAGRPIEQGWLSSHFGKRTDPFTGKPATHYGVDFAGKEGANVVAVGAGVVTFSGRRGGYGNLVEISHGNGYVTRYAHNREHLVEAGDRVEKGQVIARMGSSGRSTGPHVHFEVLRNNKLVNPGKYIAAR